MFPRWKYSLFQRWFRRTLAFQKPLAFLSEIINCFTNIFDSKELKYSPKVYICAHSTRKWQLKKKWAAIFGQRRQIAHLLWKSPDERPFSYPEPFLRAVNGRRRGALAKSISNWHLIGYNEGYCSNNVYIFYHVFMVSGFGFGQSPSSHRA